MKKNIVGSFLTLALIVVGASSAFAHGDKACAPVWEACATKNGQDHKAAHACVEKIKNGGTVDGVTVAQADVDACKAAPAHHHPHNKPATPPATDSSGAATSTN